MPLRAQEPLLRPGSRETSRHTDPVQAAGMATPEAEGAARGCIVVAYACLLSDPCDCSELLDLLVVESYTEPVEVRTVGDIRPGVVTAIPPDLVIPERCRLPRPSLVHP